MLRYFLILIIAFSITGCKEKTVIIPDFNLPTGNKVVLVEDLTGVRCPNCPTGTAKLKSLEVLYEGKLVIVGIHGDFLTFPLDESKYDFRNEYSQKIENVLKPFTGKPAAGIDRTVFESGSFALSGIETWQGYIEEQFEKQVIIDLSLELEYNQSNRNLTLEASVLPQENNLNGNYRICVMLIESDIEDAQKGPSNLIENYIHTDVLRTMLTQFDGDEINISPVAFSPTNISFDYTLPSEDGTWVADHMDVVVFITNGDTKEVVQTKKIGIIE